MALLFLGSITAYSYEVTCGEGAGPGSGSYSFCNGNLSNSSSYGSNYARQVLADIKRKRERRDRLNKIEYRDRLKAERNEKYGIFKDFRYVGEDKSSFLAHGYFTKTDTGLRFGENGELYKTNNDFVFHFQKGIDRKVYLVKINDNYTLSHGGQFALARLIVDSPASDMGRIFNIFLPNGLHSSSDDLLEGFEHENFKIIRELDRLELNYIPNLNH